MEFWRMTLEFETLYHGLAVPTSYVDIQIQHNFMSLNPLKYKYRFSTKLCICPSLCSDEAISK